MYSELTDSIKITVSSYFLEERSEPSEDSYFWAYQVRIENEGVENVRLRHRSWSITDAAGGVQEVHGAGVIGQQPVIAPGESFEYTSGTPLRTPSGIMFGSYGMEAESGREFVVTVPAFSLDSPHERRPVN
jgi:ApaG protein